MLMLTATVTHEFDDEFDDDYVCTVVTLSMPDCGFEFVPNHVDTENWAGLARACRDRTDYCVEYFDHDGINITVAGGRVSFALASCEREYGSMRFELLTEQCAAAFAEAAFRTSPEQVAIAKAAAANN